MKRGPKAQLPSTKRDRGTFRPFRDADKIEFTVAVPDSMPQKPSWLTAAGEEIWLDNVTRTVPPLTESDSVHFAIYCNLIGAIGQAYAVGDIPPMRIGGVSCLRRPSADGDHTHALVAEEGHSFPDNLVALFGHSSAQDCSAETAIRDST